MSDEENELLWKYGLEVQKIRRSATTEPLDYADNLVAACRIINEAVEKEIQERNTVANNSMATMIAEQQLNLASVTEKNFILNAALQRFVDVCDHAPPVQLIEKIGEACRMARRVLNNEFCRTCLDQKMVVYDEIPGIRGPRTAPCPDCTESTIDFRTIPSAEII